jgi:hypothetical protein
MRFLCERWRISSADKIILNFCVAAFHLSYLLEVTCCVSADFGILIDNKGHTELPSSANDIEKWFEGIEFVVTRFSLHTMVFMPYSIPATLHSVMTNIERVQLPLFLAFAISPICLLVPSSIFERGLGKDVIFEVRQPKPLGILFNRDVIDVASLGKRRSSHLAKNRIRFVADVARCC